MNAFLVAIYITIVIMMGSALVVLIWEALDNRKEKKWKIDLGEKLHREIVDFLDSDNENEIKDFIGRIVSEHLRGGK